MRFSVEYRYHMHKRVSFLVTFTTGKTIGKKFLDLVGGYWIIAMRCRLMEQILLVKLSFTFRKERPRPMPQSRCVTEPFDGFKSLVKLSTFDGSILRKLACSLVPLQTSYFQSRLPPKSCINIRCIQCHIN